MLVRSRSPLRLGLAGGGTDVSPFSDKYGGAVINATLAMYTYCSIEPTNDGTIEFYDADSKQGIKIDSKLHFDLDDEGFNLHLGAYNKIVKDYIRKPLSFRMTTYSDAGPGSGLGGSSTFVVGMVKAYAEWLSLPLGEYEIADIAFTIERIDVALAGGKQDQYAAAFGGFNFMEFYSDRVIINPLRVKDWVINELETLALLYRMKSSRDSAKIIQEQIDQTTSNNPTSIAAMQQLKKDAVSIKEAILLGNIDQFVETIRAGWQTKMKIAPSISNNEIDTIMKAASDAGALAGRVSGAGGGGHILFFVNPKQRYELISALGSFGGGISRVKFTEKGAESWTISR